MATFDQLPADQRAIIELVLQRQQSYEDLSGMLGLSPARVKELAREALGQLSPRTYERVDPQWRDQLADYLLGQQTGPEATATRGHLKSSEPARAWSNSLLDALDPLYGDAARPEIPDGGGAAEAPVRRGRRERTPPAPRERAERASRPLTPQAESVVRRRRLIGGGIAAVVAAGLIALLVVVVTGGGDDKESGDKKSGTAAGNGQAVPLGQLVMRPVKGEKGEGQAVVVRAEGKNNMVVAARGLTPNERGRNKKGGTAYEVWLYNSPKDAKSIGAQVTDEQGNYQGAGPLPEGWEKYKYLDLTREPIDENESYSGEVVLRARLADVQPVDPAQAQQQQQPGGAQGQQAPPQGGQAPP
ncbi:MAG: hypothetical protein H0V29_08670, partial [Thermoleophilaceae bacterium]|nr:hypothetical protein [Thermoleophilaceae bacterium]